MRSRPQCARTCTCSSRSTRTSLRKYLKTFAQDVWTELTKVSLNPGQVPCLPFDSATTSSILCYSSFTTIFAAGGRGLVLLHLQ